MGMELESRAMDEQDWVTVHSYVNHAQADLAVSILESAGIEVLSDNTYTSMAGIGEAGAEVHVMVKREDAERAADLLEEMDTGDVIIEGAEQETTTGYTNDEEDE
jgi:hypothetical protein